MQLLKITTVPIKYKEQENIPAENSNAAFSVSLAEKNAANVQIPVAGTQNSQNNAELYDNSVVGMSQKVQRKSDSMVHETASEKDGLTYSVDNRSVGKNRMPEPRQNVSAFLRKNVQKAVTLDSALDSIDSALPDKSWEPEAKTKSVQIHAPKPEPQKIVDEYAHVEIEYLGGFNYVPKSSAPDYEDPDEK